MARRPREQREEMREIIIGDVHGCAVELDELLDAIKPTSQDHLIFVGDLIHRGPDSARVVRRVRRLQAICNVTLILGNHEEKAARLRKRLKEGTADKMKVADYYFEVEEALGPEDVEFLDSAVLWHWLEGGRGLVIHAGVRPDLEIPDSLEVLSKKELRKLEGDLTHLRYVRYNTEKEKWDSVTLNDEQPDDTFWADAYDGRFGHIVFGHNPYIGKLKPITFPHATALDLGCVFGGRLAAMITTFDEGKIIDVSYKMVTAKAQYSDAWLSDQEGLSRLSSKGTEGKEGTS